MNTKRAVYLEQTARGIIMVCYADRVKGGRYLAAQFAFKTLAEVEAWVLSQPKLRLVGRP